MMSFTRRGSAASSGPTRRAPQEVGRDLSRHHGLHRQYLPGFDTPGCDIPGLLIRLVSRLEERVIGHGLPRSNHDASLLSAEVILGWVSDSERFPKALQGS